MADTAPTSVMDRLSSALATAEPMCLALVQVEPLTPAAGSETLQADLTELLTVRMREALRRYDQLVEIDEHAVALILRTLADATVLAARMRTFFEVSSEPYPIDGVTHDVRITLGAAVRRPQDTPLSLLNRVDQALVSAREAGAVGPVVV